MKRTKKELGGIIVSALLLLLLAGRAQAAVYLTLNPSSTSMLPGGYTDVDVTLSSDGDQYISVGFQLSFDPSVLKVVDTSAGNWTGYWTSTPIQIADANQVSPGIFAFDTHTANEVYNTAGSGHSAGKIFHEQYIMTGPPIATTGLLARIRFQAVGLGNSAVTFNTIGEGAWYPAVFAPDYTTEIQGRYTGTTLAVIPEPGTLILLGSGILGLITMRKRRI